MPVVTSDMAQQAQPNRVDDLTAKIAADLAAATVHLYTNDFTPTPQSVVADYTEAAYGGYAAQAVAGWTTPDPQLDGSVSTTATTVLTFTGPAAGAGPTIYGYFVRSAGAGTPLIYGARFDEPYPLVDGTDILNLVATLRIPALF